MSTDRRSMMTREVLAAIRLGEDSGYDFKAVYAKPGRAFERVDLRLFGAQQLCLAVGLRELQQFFVQLPVF